MTSKLLLVLACVEYHLFHLMNHVRSFEERRHHSFDDGFDIAEILRGKALGRFVVPGFLDDIRGLPPFAQGAL